MTQQYIVTTPTNSGNGTPLNTAFNYCDSNFTELYARAQTVPPGNSFGKLGDEAGFYAYDSTYFYYCYANYTGNSAIWGQVTQAGNVSATQILYGNSSVSIPSPSANVTVTVNSTSNIAVFSNVGVAVTGIVNASGNLRGGNINTNGNVSAVGNVTGNYILGNGSQLTGLPATYGNSNVATYLPTYSGNLTANTISTTGNITGNYILGNGSQLTGLPATYGNSNVATYLPTYSGNLTAGNVSVVGNVVATYFIGNGSQLTGIAGGSNYSNANVAAYLPTYSGVVTASVVSATGNVSGNYIIGNGAFLTGVATSYGNSNVATYLPTYSGNLSPGNLNVINSFTVGGTPFTRTLTVGTRLSPVTVPLATNNSFTVVGRAGNVTVYTT